MTLAPAATDRGGETRRRILEVAAVAFADRGYAGTSLSDVLKASGVTKGGFYFTSRPRRPWPWPPCATSRSSGPGW
jgi:AcrR family transcriptional regulator